MDKNLYEALSFYMDGKERKVNVKYGVRDNGVTIKKEATINFQDLQFSEDQKELLFEIWDVVIEKVDEIWDVAIEKVGE